MAVGFDGHERRACQKKLCPEGRMWGICAQPTHWADERQEHAGGGVSSTRKDMTTAHLAGTAEYNLAHAIVHLKAAMAPKSPKDQQFNLEHADHHLDEAQDHLSRLLKHFRENYPSIAKELDNIDKATDGTDGVHPV